MVLSIFISFTYIRWKWINLFLFPYTHTLHRKDSIILFGNYENALGYNYTYTSTLNPFRLEKTQRWLSTLHRLFLCRVPSLQRYLIGYECAVKGHISARRGESKGSQYGMRQWGGHGILIWLRLAIKTRDVDNQRICDRAATTGFTFRTNIDQSIFFWNIMRIYASHR